MRAAVIGGGPGGLFAATLLRDRLPGAAVTVYERNPPDATFGFGVVFSERTLDYLGRADPATYAAIDGANVTWEDIEVRIHGQTLRCGGHGFSAISRKQLLALLQERATSAGVDLLFEREVGPDPPGEWDLVLAGDGVNSVVREAHRDRLGPTIDIGAAKYIWFATSKMFDALTFIFERNEHGHFAVHAYPFDEQTSTFIVETDERSWRRAGLDRGTGPDLGPGQSDMGALDYCRELFADHLDGEPLLANNSKWLNFATVRNTSWVDGNVALLGDAAHTAHFSVGSGTKMAMEDAIALADELPVADSPEAALRAYEARRRRQVERVQAAAEPSRAWWENFGRVAARPAHQFAFHFLTRIPGVVTRERLRGRDPRFVAGVERWFAEQASAQDPRSTALATSVELGDLSLPSRLAMLLDVGDGLEGLEPARLAGPALLGAGLVFARCSDPTQPTASWRSLTEAVHAQTDAALGWRLEDTADLSAIDRVGSVGFDVLWLGAGGRDAEAVLHVREHWPPPRPLIVELGLSSPALALDRLVAEADELGRAGATAVALGLVEGQADGRLGQLLLSDAIREGAGLKTMLVAGIRTRDEAVTAVLAGRADLCLGLPDLVSESWVGAMDHRRSHVGHRPRSPLGA